MKTRELKRKAVSIMKESCGITCKQKDIILLEASSDGEYIYFEYGVAVIENGYPYHTFEVEYNEGFIDVRTHWNS